MEKTIPDAIKEWMSNQGYTGIFNGDAQCACAPTEPGFLQCMNPDNGLECVAQECVMGQLASSPGSRVVVVSKKHRKRRN